MHKCIDWGITGITKTICIHQHILFVPNDQKYSIIKILTSKNIDIPFFNSTGVPVSSESDCTSSEQSMLSD